MNDDDIVLAGAALVLAKESESLKKEKTPLSWGKRQRYLSFLPKQSADEIFNQPGSAYLHWYAAEVADFQALIDAMPYVNFEEKKRKNTAG